MKREGICGVIMLDAQGNIQNRADELGVNLEGVQIFRPQSHEKFDAYCQAFYEMRKHKGIGIDEARESVSQPLFLGAMMVRDGEVDGSVAGCCALEVIWSNLAEIKSLAVDETKKEKGIGRMLVTAAIEQAVRLGVPKVFALTLEPEFFEKLGFEKVEKETLPMKVWSDCAKCPKQEKCDEIAVVKTVLRDAY